MIGADLESLRLTHNKTNFFSGFMLQELHASCAPLLPLISVFIKTIKLRFPIPTFFKEKKKVKLINKPKP